MANQDTYNKLRAQLDKFKDDNFNALGESFGSNHDKAAAGLKAIQDKINALKAPDTASGMDVYQVQQAIIEQETLAANKAKSATDPNFIDAISKIKQAQATIDGYKKSGVTTNSQMEKGYQDYVKQQSDAAKATKTAADAATKQSSNDASNAKQNAINEALGKSSNATPIVPPLTTLSGRQASATKDQTAQQAAAVSVPTPTGGAGTGASGGKTPPPAKAMTQAQAFQNFKDQYSQEAALIASDPGLKAIFDKALSATGGAWAPAKFQTAYEQSAYVQNHAPSYTTAEQARFGDHGAYLDAYNNMFKYVTQWSKDAGIQLDPSVLGGALPTTDLKAGVSAVHPYDPKNPTLIDDLLHKYWDTGIQHQADITRYLATKQKLNPAGGYQAVGGQEFTDAQNLKAYYASMGQNAASVTGKSDPNDPTGDVYFANLAHSIAAGTTNSQSEQSKALESAKAMFPTYSGALDAGQSVQGIASPYINSLSSLLETSPNGIDLSQSTGDSQKIKTAMGAGLGQTPMSLTDFEASVRKDPRWDKTLNAQNTVESYGHSILKDFGLAN